MAIKEDGTDKEGIVADDVQTGSRASQFVPASNADTSAIILTEDEAERKGDFTALQRIKLANAAREANEHFDVNGDGFVANSLSSGQEGENPGLYGRDDCGGYYAKSGDYYDKFGGHYDPYGYEDKAGNYTSDSGEHWDKKTGKVTNADGTERKVDSTVVRDEMEKDPNVGKTVVQVDEQFRRRRVGAKPKEPRVDKKKASETEGGGTPTVTPPPSKEDKAKTEIVIEERKASGQDVNGPATTEEMKHADQVYQWRLKHVSAAREALSEFIVGQNVAGDEKQAADPQKDGSGKKPKFKAVSKAEATAKLGHIHLPPKADGHIHAPDHHGGSADHDHDAPTNAKPDPAAKTGGDAKPKDQKSDATTGADGNWYQDARGGYWDEFGGYYDKDGGYWEADGGYWDKYNVYTDVNGGRTWPDGSYLDPNFNYVDKDGCYYMEDGTQIKPPAGMDFKKQMQEAATKHEKWHLPEELIPLLQSKAPVLPELTLSTVSPVAPLVASSFTPMKFPDPKADASPKIETVTRIETPLKLDSVPLKLEPVKLGANLDLPPLKLNTSIGLPPATGASFSLLDPKQNSTPAKPEGNFNQYQMCTTQGDPKKNDFSSFFNNYHTFLTSEKPIGETKYYDLSNITLSPGIGTKPQFASLTTPDNKGIIPSPKNLA
jgi:hypothetical protein